MNTSFFELSKQILYCAFLELNLSQRVGTNSPACGLLQNISQSRYDQSARSNKNNGSITLKKIKKKPPQIMRWF